MSRAVAVTALLAAVLTVLTADVPAQAAEVPGPLQTDGRWWRDADGRVVLLHGVNVVKKVAPYIPSDAEFGMADAEAIAALGWNTVRLGFIWAGMQPERGVVDPAYLERLAAIVHLLGARGINVLLDSHQDLWNERWGGEGAPDWAVFQPGARKQPSWFLTYFTSWSLGLAYWDLWSNRAGILDEYADMWRQVAERFSGNPHVIGYDVMNEPWTSPLWFLPQDRFTVQRMYERVIPAIRSVDTVHAIFWESSLPSSQFFKDTMDLEGDRLAYSFHVYCPLATIFGRELWPSSACRDLDRQALRHARRARDSNAGGWLVTEYGAMDLAEGIGEEADLFDREYVGWQYWQWKDLDDPTTHEDSRLVEEPIGPIRYRDKVAVLERTYARRVAGTPTHHSFDTATSHFELEYSVDAGIAAPTEIWLPLERHYPDGFDLAVSGGTVSTGIDPHVLLIAAHPGATTVNISIEAR